MAFVVKLGSQHLNVKKGRRDQSSKFDWGFARNLKFSSKDRMIKEKNEIKKLQKGKMGEREGEGEGEKKKARHLCLQ